MIKRNIKMKVTPEESKQVQEICFANGIGWSVGSTKIMLEHKQYLIIRDYISWDDKGSFYDKNLERVDATFFIKTKGSCIEENQEQDYKAKQGKEFIQYLETQPEEVVEEAKPKQYLCYVSGKALPKHIHKTLEQATQEAQRLCRKELTEVMVLEVVSKYQAKVIAEEV